MPDVELPAIRVSFGTEMCGDRLPDEAALFLMLRGERRVVCDGADHRQRVLTSFFHKKSVPFTVREGSFGLSLSLPDRLLSGIDQSRFGGFWKLEHPFSQRLALRLLDAWMRDEPIEGHLRELLAPCGVLDTARLAAIEPQSIRRSEAFLRASFQGPLHLSDVADEACIHPVYLARLFRKLRGCSVMDYVNILRATAAARLVVEDGWTLGAAGAEVGFFDQAHFDRSCRKSLGIAPRSLRWLKSLAQSA